MILAAAHVNWIEASALATAALAIATFAFVIVAALQRHDTSRTADAAQRAAVASEATIAMQRQSWDEESRLTTYPALFCEFFFDEQGTSIHVSNASSFPAADVDIVFLSLFHTDTDDPMDFVRRFVAEEHRDEAVTNFTAPPKGDDFNAWELSKFFGFYDHLTYATVPPRSAVTAPINAPFAPWQFTMLLQFRDLVGRNYCRVYSGAQSSDPDNPKYMFEMTPQPIDELLHDIPRIEYLGYTNALGDVAVFGEHIERSIPSGYMKQPLMDVEERGQWSSR
jgi:hypothetical protein